MRETRKILPGATIGILGGGQLGRMIALAGRNMGYRFVTLDPTKDSPCGQVADGQIVAPFDDIAAAEQLAEQCDVITYEFENVSSAVADKLSTYSYVPQGSALLYTTQHRLREKRAIEAAGVQVAPYAAIRTLADLEEAVARYGVPCVLKTTTGGYDGKGQRVIRDNGEIAAAYAALAPEPYAQDAAVDGDVTAPLVLEQYIPFEREISVIAARSPRGEVKVFPVAENIHIDNILHMSIVPARIPVEASQRAEQLATRIAEHLQVIGLIAVEMFMTASGELYVNELAPRPHNSGHYTMEACRTSQFEQHVRAVCNLPLGSTELVTPVVMVNVLGEHVAPLLQWLETLEGESSDPIVKIHLYGKKDAVTKRKMGHVNLLVKDHQAAFDWIHATKIWDH